MLPTYFVVCYFTLAIWLLRFWLTLSKQTLLLPTGIVSATIIIKYAVGCAYGYLFLKVYKGDDTWLYHQLALTEYAMLKQDPIAFVLDLFKHPYTESQAHTFLNSNHSYWKDLQYNILIKLLALFNVLSRGNYYINVLFFNLLTFWGHYYLYALMVKLFPKCNRIVLLPVFLFPPLLFWESGIRKDGLVFVCITGCLYFMYLLVEHSFTWKRLCAFSLFFVGLLLTRSFVALSFIPPVIAYLICAKSANYKYILSVFAIVMLVFVGLFFGSSWGAESWNLPKKMAERQEKFLDLNGGSYMAIDSLSGQASSYLKVLPQAANHSFLRPYVWEGGGMLQLFSALETWLVLLLLIASVVFKRKIWQQTLLNKPMVVAILLFAIINYLIIGYTVPFAGAIVRYRVIFESYLLLMTLLTFQKFFLKFRFKLISHLNLYKILVKKPTNN